VEHLLQIVGIKALCRRANIERLEVGPKGAAVAFRGNVFANPAGLIEWIAGQGSLAKIRPDQTVVLIRDWGDVGARLKGTANVVAVLARLAGQGERAAA
jgi:transcription-repair coupling factor (superfamily II helicase)